jgi:phosphoribosylglycinamide formyltransferase 1
MEALLRDAREGAHPAPPALVIANRPDAAGLETARSLGIQTLAIDHKVYGDRAAFEEAITGALVAHQIDWVVLAGFMRVLTHLFVDRWQGRLVNIHPSLLPAYPGLNTHQRVLDAGEMRHGCTVHIVHAGVDTGPAFATASLDVRPGESASDLAARVQTLEHIIYPRAIRAITGGDVWFENEKAVYANAHTARHLNIEDD